MSAGAARPFWDVRSALPGATWPAVPAPGAAAVLALLHQLDDSQWLAPDQLAAMQRSQLGLLLAHAHATVPYYRTLWGRAPDAADLPELPLLTRRALQENFDALRSSNLHPAHQPVSEVSTSGSTGAPVRVLRTAISQVVWRAITLRDHLWHARDLRGKLVTIRHRARAERAANWGRATDGLVATGPAAGLGSTETDTDAQLAWLQREQPDYLLTYPTIVGELARASIEHGIRLAQLREVRTFTEQLDPDLRELCLRAWGVKLTDMYSTAEIGYLALQCPRSEHYHVQSEAVLLEVLDEHGKPCRPGEIGRVVVTALHSHAMPLVRYEIGDYAEVGAPCPCGRGLPVLRRILGRVRNMLVTADGRRYWPYFGGPRGIRAAAPVWQYQFAQKAHDLLEARVVTARPLVRDEEERLRACVLACVPPGMRLDIVYRDHIARSAGGKFEEFVSEIDSP